MKKLLKRIIGYFNKEKIDWLDEEPYLGRYFIYKLKRLIMNLIYNIWEGIDKYALEQYFAEISFTNNEKDYKAYMPFIILSRNKEEALDVLGQINAELVKTYHLEPAPVILSEKIVTQELLEQKKREILESFDQQTYGNIEFSTLRGQSTVSNQIKHLGEETQNSLAGNFTTLKKTFQFKIIKAKNKEKLRNEEFSIKIENIEKIAPPKIDINTEASLDLINRMNNFK